MGRKMKIRPNMLAQTLEKEFALQHEGIVKNLKSETQKSMKRLVTLTKEQVYDRDTGKYRNAISSRKLRETSQLIIYQWYVKAPAYRLSHLLNNGHATRSGGRTKAYNHITNATETVTKEYQQNVAEVLASGK